MESRRLGFARLSLPGTAVLTSCSGSPGNYLNRINLEAGNSASCDNPSFAAYFNSVPSFFDKNIGIISKTLTVTCIIFVKYSENFVYVLQVVCTLHFETFLVPAQQEFGLSQTPAVPALLHRSVIDVQHPDLPHLSTAVP